MSLMVRTLERREPLEVAAAAAAAVVKFCTNQMRVVVLE